MRRRHWPPPEPSGPPWAGRSCPLSLRLRRLGMELLAHGRTTIPETVALAADIVRCSTSSTCSRVQWPRSRRLRVPPRPDRLFLGRMRICAGAGSSLVFPLNGSLVDTGWRVLAAVLATWPDPDVRALRDEGRKCRRFGCDPPLLWWRRSRRRVLLVGPSPRPDSVSLRVRSFGAQLRPRAGGGQGRTRWWGWL